MSNKFKNALTGDIQGRHTGVIYGSGNRYNGVVSHTYSWTVSHDEINHWKYVWCYRKTIENGEVIFRPFSFKKVKSIPGVRGCSIKTIIKMVDVITQYVLEFESDDEIHFTELGKGRSPKQKRFKLIYV